MTQREFIENVGHMGHVYKTDLLKTLYNSIKQAPIQWARYVQCVN